MALSIVKRSVFVEVSIPVASSIDTTWQDNTWLVQHLRQMADYIEQEKPEIYSFSVKTDSQYKIPYIGFEHFNRD